MTIQQILGINSILQKIAELKLPIQKSYKIYNLIKQIQKQQEFAKQEINKIIQQFEGKIEENGNITFSSNENQIEFINSYNTLMTTQIEENDIITLSLVELSDLQLSSSEIASLEGIIEFIE